LERRNILWIGRFALPGEVSELLAPSPTDRIDKLRIEMADEKLKRCDFAVFLSHEQERDEGGQQNGAGRYLESFHGN
jgi:hypothetical protein